MGTPMFKFLLVIVFFFPSSGQNQSMAVAFPTLEACLATKERVPREIQFDDEVWYVLECIEGSPTTGIRI